MDLLDELEALERQTVRARTFKKNLTISIAEDDDSEDGEFAQHDAEASPETGVLNDTTSSLLNARAPIVSMKPPSVGNLFGSGLSVLEKVKRRLNGEPQEELKETQIIEPSLGLSPGEVVEQETQEIIQTNELETQKITQTNENSGSDDICETQETIQTQKTARCGGDLDNATEDLEVEDEDEGEVVPLVYYTKLAILTDDEDDSEAPTLPAASGYINEASASSKVRNTLFVEEESEEEIDSSQAVAPTQEIPEGLTLEEERAAKLKRILELADKKKTTRLLKEQQEKSKDEKNLENTKELEKEIAEGDEYSSDEEVRRDESLNLIENVVKKFVKTDLLAAFGLPKTGIYGANDLLSSEKNHTPSTTPLNSSPVKLKTEKVGKRMEIELDDDDESDRDIDVLDLLKKPTKLVKSETLKMTLKEPEYKPDMIDLDDSDESDDNITVHLSKSAVLDIKARFSKKNIELKRNKLKNTMLTKNQMFEKLKSASKQQIKESRSLFPEGKEKFDMMQPQEIEVEDLLRKYVDHARVVKEQEEKKHVKISMSLAHSDEDSEDDLEYNDGEVPESEDDASKESDSDGDVEQSEGVINISSSQIQKITMDDDDDDQSVLKMKKSRRKNFIEEDDVDEDDQISHVLDQQNTHSNIDLGYFGGNISQNQTQKLRDMLGVSMTAAFDDVSQACVAMNNTSGDIFKKLRRDGEQVLGEDVSFADESMKDDSFGLQFGTQEVAQPLFEEPETQLADIHPPSTEATQLNNPHSTQDRTTQLVDTQEDSATIGTMKDVVTQMDSLDDSSVRVHKRLFKKSEPSWSEESESEDEEERTGEERLKLADYYKQQRRQEVQDQKKMKKQIKARGLDKIMENEAEESEDEWVGVGGADGERSDEENSDDEKMFDDVTNIKQNRSELAKKIAAEEAETDQKMLLKILKDLETGNWKRRGGGEEGLDFVDEEDEVMRRYRMYQQSKLRGMFEEDEKLRQLARDKKSKAFFESITEDSQNDMRKDIFGRVESEGSSSDDDNDNPFVDKTAKEKMKSPEEVSRKKRKRITEAFVHKSLSFLSELDEVPQNHDFDDDDCDDLHTLKQKSLVKLQDSTPQRRRPITVDLSTSPSDAFKVPSVVKRSFLKSEGSIKNNEVTISTSYKAASSSHASIMSMGKGKNISKVDETHRVLKARKMEKTMKKTTGMLKSLGSAFE